MIDTLIIEEIKSRLVKVYDPLKIYIFGSYAWGCPDEESDIDLFIVVDALDNDRYTTLINGHRALKDMRISKEIIVYTKEEFEKDSKDITTLSYKIKRKGKEIYAKA